MPAREALAALLRGEAEGWRHWRDRPVSDLVGLAATHGVLALLADLVEPAGEDCPPPLHDALRAEFRRHLAADLVREHELRRLVAAFAAAGVRSLLMKGADVAYGAYPRPELRSRTDTDLLVAPSARAAATAVLVALDYELVPQSGGDLLMYQEPFRLLRDGRVAHVVDLHWRVFNPQRYGTSLSFDHLDGAAEPRPSLATAARGSSTAHALALACVHRVAHHFDQDRLIWLYDVRVLAAKMRDDDWSRFAHVVTTNGLQIPCIRSLDAARRDLDADIPDAVFETLRAAGGGEADAAFLDPRSPHALRILSDFRHVRGWTGRIRLARQHLFPPASYMRTVYAPASAAPLWALYLRRIVQGSRRWLVRS